MIFIINKIIISDMIFTDRAINHSRYDLLLNVTNGAIVIHTQRLKSDLGGNLLS